MLNARGLCYGRTDGEREKGGSLRNSLSLDLPSLSEPGRGDADGSLPTSPDFSCGESLGEARDLDLFTRSVLVEFLCPDRGSARPVPQRRRVLQTMRRVVDGLLLKHQFVYTGMLTKLSLDSTGGDMTLVSSVVKEIFGDGVTNWGRVASLLAFGTAVCQYETENGRVSSTYAVAEIISSYLLSDQRKWLVKNKAWDGFVEFFEVPDPESTVRTALMAFVTVAGIGASIAFLSR